MLFGELYKVVFAVLNAELFCLKTEMYASVLLIEVEL